MTPMTTATDRRSARHRRFMQFRDAVWSHLPFRLYRWVPATLIGFALINGTTFLIDLGLLTVLYGQLHVPHTVAVVVAYCVAFGLAFVLNRNLNFQSRGHVGAEAVRYVAVTLINFAVIVVAGNAALHELGVQYQIARTAVACAEVVWMYATMRWFVFGRPQGQSNSSVSRPRRTPG